MNNADLKKALKRLISGTYDADTKEYVIQTAINRLGLQESEIDRLKDEKSELEYNMELLKQEMLGVRERTIKELIEKLNAMPSVQYCEYEELHTDIYSVKKKMLEGCKR